MQFEFRLHRLILVVLAVLLAGIVTTLLYIHPSLEDMRLEAIASLIVVSVIAGVFLIFGIVGETVAVLFGLRHKRELLSYLVLGLVSIGLGIYFAISNTASLHTVAIVAAPYAFFIGLAELRVAQHLRRHPWWRGGLLAGSFCDLALGLGFAHAYISTTSSRHIALLLVCAATTSIFKLIPLIYYQRGDAGPFLDKTRVTHISAPNCK